MSGANKQLRCATTGQRKCETVAGAETAEQSPGNIKVQGNSGIGLDPGVSGDGLGDCRHDRLWVRVLGADRTNRQSQ